MNLSAKMFLTCFDSLRCQKAIFDGFSSVKNRLQRLQGVTKDVSHSGSKHPQAILAPSFSKAPQRVVGVMRWYHRSTKRENTKK